MNRFREELEVIPRGAYILASVAYIGLAAAIGAILWPKVGEPAPMFWGAAVLIALLGPLFLAAYILLLGYVYGDARRRHLRYVAWTLLAIFIPNAIGVILYFLLRDRAARTCPNGRAGVDYGHVYCPHCGTSVIRTCPSCHRPGDPGWSWCAYCGAKAAETAL